MTTLQLNHSALGGHAVVSSLGLLQTVQYEQSCTCLWKQAHIYVFLLCVHLGMGLLGMFSFSSGYILVNWVCIFNPCKYECAVKWCSFPTLLFSVCVCVCSS